MSPALFVADQPSDDEDEDAPLVVLVHGGMDRSTSFVRVVALLADDCHVVSYDRRGYARSRDVEPGGGFDQQLDDFFEVLGERPCVAVGHSYGAAVVMGAAARRPDLVRAVAVYEPPMPWLTDWPQDTAGSAALRVVGEGGDPEKAAEAFMRWMVGDDDWERLPPRTQAERRAEGVALVADMRSIRTGQAPFSPDDLTVPVVVGCGTESPAHLRDGARRVAEAVPGAELVEFKGAGHGAHTSHPIPFVDLVRRALARSGV